MGSGTVTLPNGITVYQTLNFSYLSLMLDIHTDDPAVKLDPDRFYATQPPVYPLPYVGQYSSYELVSSNPDQILLWYLTPFQVNVNTLYCMIPIYYLLSQKKYLIFNADVTPGIPGVHGVIPLTAQGTVTVDRIYFPHWKATPTSNDSQNKVYINKGEIINYPLYPYPQGLVPVQWHATFTNGLNIMS